MKRIKKFIFETLDDTRIDSNWERYFNIFMMLLIILNVVSVIMETEESIIKQFRAAFYGFEVFSIAVFTIEYILRIWSCTENPKYQSPFWGRIRYALQSMAIIDLISFLPFYLPVGGLDLRFVRAIRLVRIFRILKMGRYFGC